MPTVVPADSRPLSWPPIGALPRNRLASPATGGVSPISPTPRLHRTPCPAPVGRGALTPPHDTHRTASQKLSLRGAQRRGNPSSPSRPPRNSPCVGAGFYPARLYRIPIPRVGGGVLDAPHTPHLQPCHCEPVRTPVWQSVISTRRTSNPVIARSAATWQSVLPQHKNRPANPAGRSHFLRNMYSLSCPCDAATPAPDPDRTSASCSPPPARHSGGTAHSTSQR